MWVEHVSDYMDALVGILCFLLSFFCLTALRQGSLSRNRKLVILSWLAGQGAVASYLSLLSNAGVTVLSPWLFYTRVQRA